MSAVHALLGQASKGRTREYAEPSRSCEQRARTAAVFVALTLAPPDIAAGDEA